MSRNTTASNIRNLFDFVSDTEGMDNKDISNELQQRGFNLKDIYRNASNIIRKGIQAQIKEEVCNKEKSKQPNLSIIKQRIYSMKIEQCKELFNSICNLDNFSQNQQKVALAFRNQNNDDMSEDDLRSCLIDILSLENSDEK